MDWEKYLPKKLTNSERTKLSANWLDRAECYRLVPARVLVPLLLEGKLFNKAQIEALQNNNFFVKEVSLPSKKFDVTANPSSVLKAIICECISFKAVDDNDPLWNDLETLEPDEKSIEGLMKTKWEALVNQSVPLLLIAFLEWIFNGSISSDSLATKAIQERLQQIKEEIKEEDMVKLLSTVPIGWKIGEPEEAVKQLGIKSLKTPIVPIIKLLLQNLKLYSNCIDVIMKVKMHFPEMKGLTPKDFSIYLLECMPNYHRTLGELFSRLIEPLPLYYPCSEGEKPLKKLLLDTSKLTFPCPYVLSFGCPQIGKSWLLNKLFQVSFEEIGKDSTKLFHNGSADIALDRLPNTTPRGFHLIDFHGDWTDHFPFIKLAFSICFSIIIQLKIDDFGSDGKIINSQLNELMNESKNKKTIIIIRDYEAKSVLKLEKIKALHERVFTVKNLEGNSFDIYTYIETLSLSLKGQLTVDSNTYTVDMWDIKAIANSLEKEKGTPVNFITCTPEMSLQGVGTKINTFLHQKDKRGIDKDALFSFTRLHTDLARCSDDWKKKVLSSQNQSETLVKQSTIKDKLKTAQLSEPMNYFLSLVSVQNLEAIFEFGLQLENQAEPMLRPFKDKDSKLREKEKNLKGELEKLEEERKKKKPEQPKTDEEKNKTAELSQIMKERHKILSESSKVSIGIDLFWRELKYFIYSSPNATADLRPKFCRCLVSLCERGYQTELVDGQKLEVDQEFLKDMGDCLKERRSKTKVIAVLGTQSQGKSTLLNFLFGCHFLTSEIRCTTGINMSILRSEDPNWDNIVILDTEGLSSIEGRDLVFDRVVGLFCLSVVDDIIINLPVNLGRELNEIIKFSLAGIHKLSLKDKAPTRIHFVLRNLPSTSSENAVDQTRRAVNKALGEITSFYKLESNLLDFQDRFVYPMISAFSSGLPAMDFIKSCKKLREILLEKRIMPRELPLPSLFNLVYERWTVVSSDYARDLISFTDFEEASQWETLNGVLKKLLKNLQVELKEIFDKEIKTLRETAEQSVFTDNFKNTIIVTTSEITKELEKVVENKAKELCANFKEATKQFKEVKEETITNFENRLLKRCRSEGDSLRIEWELLRQNLEYQHILHKSLSEIKKRFNEIKNRRESSISKESATIEFDKVWQTQQKKFEEEISAIAQVDRSTLLLKWLVPIYEKYADNAAIYAIKIPTGSFVEDSTKLVFDSTFIDTFFANKINRSYSDEERKKLKKALFPLFETELMKKRVPEKTLITNVFRDALPAETSNQLASLQILPILSDQTVNSVIDSIQALLRELEMLTTEKLKMSFKGSDLVRIVHNNIAIKIVDIQVFKNEAYKRETKRKFADQEASQRAVFVSTLTGIDQDQNTGQALADQLFQFISNIIYSLLRKQRIASFRAAMERDSASFAMMCFDTSVVNGDADAIIAYTSQSYKFMQDKFNNECISHKESWEKEEKEIATKILSVFKKELEAAIASWRINEGEVLENIEQETKRRNNIFSSFIDLVCKIPIRLNGEEIKIDKERLVRSMIKCEITSTSTFKLAFNNSFENLNLQFDRKVAEFNRDLWKCVEEQKVGSFRRAFGCTAVCPYCGQKCDLELGHEGKHNTDFHIYLAFRGWHDSTHKIATLWTCTSLMAQQANFRSWKKSSELLPFQENLTQWNSENPNSQWNISNQNYNLSRSMDKINQIQTAWKKAGRKICTDNGIKYHEYFDVSNYVQVYLENPNATK